MKVEQFTGSNGQTVKNQFLITDDDFGETFQSYDSVIAVRRGGKVTLDREKWDYSKTTGKYRNQFLGETKAETERKINSGEYELADLN